MSETNLDLKEQIARIDLMLAQLERAQQEIHKFVVEERKRMAETSKLDAETAKLRVDRFVAPALALAAVSGALGAILVKVFGG